MTFHIQVQRPSKGRWFGGKSSKTSLLKSFFGEAKFSLQGFPIFGVPKADNLLVVCLWGRRLLQAELHLLVNASSFGHIVRDHVQEHHPPKQDVIFQKDLGFGLS